MRSTVLLALCTAITLTISIVSVTAAAQDRDQTLQSLLADARAAQSRGDFSQAAEAYRKAVALEPSVPELWANLGLMDHESGMSSEAIQSFKRAIRLNPSLFVPQLFLGIEYLKSKNPEAAIPFLENAEKLNPNDLQAALSLGKAYTLSNHADRAVDAYSIATRLTPNDGDTWLNLGTAYLQEVENDARLMTSVYSHSAYVSLRAAETLAEEGRPLQAENAYKAAIASGSPPPCTHAEFGITLLRTKDLTDAREQFELETKTGSHCGLAGLGSAVTQLDEGHPEDALTKLISISAADPGFVASSLPLFRDAVSPDQAKSLIDLSRAREKDDSASVEIGSLIAKTLVSDETPSQFEFSDVARPSSIRAVATANAERLYAAGQYARCSEALKPVLGAIASNQLQLLVSCSFYAGDFRTASTAAQRLKSNPATRAEGLYWETKADQRLAIAALTRAGEIDAGSPRMHVLLGDVFRQKRHRDEAEAEYRKAVSLDPKSRSARLSLAITLFTELKTDEAFNIDRSLLAEDPNDPEANLLAGEILVQRNTYAEAEPYLSRCGNLQPEFVPRLHALLGQVYAATDRIPAAILEYKKGLSTDEDGSIHYQLGRLYQKSSDKNAAEEAFRESKRLRQQWDNRARLALEQTPTDTIRQ
ncbi:MAG: tetratricopeptide repeat protein [Terracidiphilus sp.]